ncbi:hypothetical protein GCM10027093_67430 [Paraburkholderia jirisanensis]
MLGQYIDISAGAHKNVFFIGDGIIRAARASMMESDAQNAKAHGDAIRHEAARAGV